MSAAERSGPAPRLHHSMDLLRDLARQAAEPGYAAASVRRHRWWVIGLTLMVAGLMVGSAVGDRLRAAPADQIERDQLIARIDEAARRVDDLRVRVDGLNRENQRLGAEALGRDPAAAEVQRRIEVLAPATGMQAVAGPGVTMIADDAGDEQRGSKVVDIDVRQAVNGLWRSGAEAIAVNGHRLSSRTAIRGAGDAITVDYRSLTRPYRIEAIGDPQGLLAAFPSTPGGAWWAYLKQNYGIRYEVTSSTDLRLEADPGLGLTNAQKK